MREIHPAPPALVSGGKTQFGTFSTPFEVVNALDADIRVPVPVPRPIKRLRLKEWQAFQFANEKLFVNVALFNAKILGLAQVKIYDRVRRKKILFERKLPPWMLTLPRTLLDSDVALRARGCVIRFHNQLASDRMTIELEIEESRSTPRIAGTVTGFAAGCQPLVVSIPFGDNHGMVSHKGQMPAEGVLQVGSETIQMDRTSSYLFMDDHKGYYPLEMKWDWLTGGGFDDRGRRFGFNLTRNQSIDQERFNECGFWIDGELELLPPVRFTRDRSRDPEVWTVRDEAGCVDLRFDIELQSDININALVLKSRYRGPFGRVQGVLRGPTGRELKLNDAFGMGEDFYLRC